MKLLTQFFIGSCAIIIIFAMPLIHAEATPVTFSGDATSVVSGSLLSASAVFDIVGGNLQVTLTNTSLADVLN